MILILSDFGVNCKIVKFSHANISLRTGFEEPNDGVREEELSYS